MTGVQTCALPICTCTSSHTHKQTHKPEGKEGFICGFFVFDYPFPLLSMLFLGIIGKMCTFHKQLVFLYLASMTVTSISQTSQNVSEYPTHTETYMPTYSLILTQKQSHSIRIGKIKANWRASKVLKSFVQDRKSTRLNSSH